MPRKPSSRSTPSQASKGGIRALERTLQFLSKTQDDLSKMQESLEELHGIMSKAAEEPRREDRAASRRGATTQDGRHTRQTKGRGGKARGRARDQGTRAALSGGQRSNRLSRSTKYAKWIESPDDHEDQPGQSLVTRNHDVIRKWAETRDAGPATIPGTRHGKRPGVLRFDFPGYGGEELEKASWEEWFEPFDERNLAFHFQEHKTDGSLSNFFRLDSPDREDA